MVRQMQEVELLDGEELDGPVDAAAGVRPDRRRRWRAVLAVALGVVALVGVQQVVDARDRAAWARVADLDGVARSLGDTLEVSTPDAQMLRELDDASRVGVPLAQVVVAADGSQSVMPTFVDDGHPSWSTPVLGPDPDRASAEGGVVGASTCAQAADAKDTAVCMVSDGYFVFSSDGDGGGEQVDASVTKIVVVQTARGEILAEWPTVPARALTTLPGLVVVAAGGDPSVVTVVAYDQSSGAERWRYEVPRSEATSAMNVVNHGPYGTLYAAGEVVAVATDGSLTLLDADGRFVRDDLRPLNGYGYSSGRALVVLSTASTDALATTVVAPDGDPAADRVYAGELANPGVDDGSVPGLVLTVTNGALTLAEQIGDEPVSDGARPGLHGYDSATGEELWFVGMSQFPTGTQPTSVIVLDERVYVTSPDAAVTALDARTGATVWSTDEPGTEFGIVTDGRLVLARAQRSADESGPQLVGWDLDTGAEVWRAPLPRDVDAVSVVNHTLLGLSFSTGQSVVIS
jgi:outer membrane protein assembly factor BamB